MSACILVSCNREATTPPEEPNYCGPHFEYVHTVLADDRYRTEEPPVMMADGSLQGALFPVEEEA